jgi:hypothetical protein
LNSSSSSSSSSTSSGGSSEPSVSYAMLGARVQLEATNMPLQQDAWKQLSIYRQVSWGGGSRLKQVSCLFACKSF